LRAKPCFKDLFVANDLALAAKDDRHAIRPAGLAAPRTKRTPFRDFVKALPYGKYLRSGLRRALPGVEQRRPVDPPHPILPLQANLHRIIGFAQDDAEFGIAMRKDEAIERPPAALYRGEGDAREKAERDGNAHPYALNAPLDQHGLSADRNLPMTAIGMRIQSEPRKIRVVIGRTQHEIILGKFVMCDEDLGRKRPRFS
jgi:hypothetical protein